MSDLTVTERRLRPILDAVASRNWKQALQQCDKWQKKGEKSDRFLALKASILINQPDKSQVEKGKTETLQLCHRTPAVTDIEALYQLQDSLKHLSLHNEEGPKLWERAIAARPSDKDLLTTLLNGSIGDGNWLSAQKAAMALRKAFPKERQYDFWNMLLCYLIHQDRYLPQKERDLFGRLAYMLMSKAADSVPAGKDELLATGKAVATPEELALLVRIYTATGHAEQAAKVLQSDTLGLKSRIAELDPQFTFSLLLDVLGTSENQQEVFSTCKSFILSGSVVSQEHREDDRVWRILANLDSNNKTSPTIADECLELASSILKSDPKCRAAYLAYFDLSARIHASGGTINTDTLVSTCVSYYEAFSQKPFCFGDIVRPLQLSDKGLLSFCSRAKPEEGNPIQQAISLKLKHAFLDTGSDPATEADYIKLARQAVRLHKQLPKEKSECPEMLLLAATILLRLSIKTRNSDYAFQASYILHSCDTKFNEYYPVAIRLVQLHLTLGQISLAMERFAALAVKNMQWETVGHLLLSRMSTLHPWNSGGNSESANPLVALDAGLTMLENADRSLDKAILEGLKYGSYSNIIDSVKVKDSMANSMNRQVFTVEERRIHRIVGVPQDTALDPFPAAMVDQRDFSFIPYLGNFNGRRALEESLSCGPLPRKPWLSAMMLQDHLTTYLKAELAAQTTLATSTSARLKTISDKIESNNSGWTANLTLDELETLRLHQTISNAVLVMKEPTSTNQTTFDTHIEKIRQWINATTTTQQEPGTTTINGVEIPTWKFLHTSFTQLETLQTISLFLGLQARRSKTIKVGKGVTVSKDTLADLQNAAAEASRAVHVRAKKLKDGINVSGVLGRLVDVAAGRVEKGDGAESKEYNALAGDIAELIDEAALEEYCGRLKESWEDALDGVLRTKIKVVK